MQLEDEVIKHRLLIEGESGSDDKRITTLLKGYFRWLYAKESESECQESCQALLDIVQHCENSMRQSVLIAKMNLIESDEYEEINKFIDKNIEDVIKKVSICKQELIEAKNIRENRLEYDRIAQEIDKNPDRSTSEKTMKALQNKEEIFKQSRKNFDRIIELRKKQFHLLLFATKSLQNVLENENIQLPDLDFDNDFSIESNQMETS